jgi:hypothetical protein
MNKRIGFIGSPHTLTSNTLDNTGNMIHSHAAYSLFDKPETVSIDLSNENIQNIRSNFSHIGFIAATNLPVNNSPIYTNAHKLTADFIEKLELPVCVFGFGSQAKLTDTIRNSSVNKNSVRLLQVLADQAHTIGVRGEFTADLCAKYGVRNVSVIGCQSAYLAAIMRTPINQATANQPCVNITNSHDETYLLSLAIKNNTAIIGQINSIETAIINDKISRADFISNDRNYNLNKTVDRCLQLGLFSRSDYFDYIKNNFRKFYDVPSWRSYIANHHDFCIGTRFHGNMAAFQSGIATIWLEHDMRTKELCDHFSLPKMELSNIKKFSSFKDIAVTYDESSFWGTIPTRTREFLEYLNDNGVSDMLDSKILDKLSQLSNTANHSIQNYSNSYKMPHKINFDNFFANLKIKTVDLFSRLTSESENRLNGHGLKINYITPDNVITPDSHVLVIEFNAETFVADCEIANMLKNKYKKIAILKLLLSPDYTSNKFVDLPQMPENAIVETLDDYTHQVYAESLSRHHTISLNKFTGEPDDILGKVSVVCACMNRSAILRINLMSWLNFPQIGEIVIVDWSSNEPLDYLTSLDPRIKIVRVDNQKYFNISQALNLAIECASLDYILKLDVDYFMNPYYNFFNLHPINADVFYSGYWKNMSTDLPKPIFLHLSGLCYVKKDIMMAVNGYNEHFSGYGGDDCDLYRRIKKLNKKQLYIRYDYSIIHVPHGPGPRIANYPNQGWNGTNNYKTSTTMGIAPSRVRSWTIKNTSNPNYFLAHDPTL